MEEPEITVQDVKQQLQRIKEKKSPGPDGMKPDILKILGTDEQCTQVLTYVLNKIMRQEVQTHGHYPKQLWYQRRRSQQ